MEEGERSERIGVGGERRGWESGRERQRCQSDLHSFLSDLLDQFSRIICQQNEMSLLI